MSIFKLELPRISQEVVARVRAGKYTLQEFISFTENNHVFFNQMLPHVVASTRGDILEHIVSSGFRPTVDDLKLAMLYEKPEFLDILCKSIGNSDSLSRALILASKQVSPIYTEILLKNGADPNFAEGRAFFDAAELGRLDIMKVLYKNGTRLQQHFFDAACYWGHNEAAYWLYLVGNLSGYETAEFEQYKAEQERKRQGAARKIQFWYMRRLCRNMDFLLRQAAKSYDRLYGEAQA